MSVFTLDALRTIMRQAAGEWDTGIGANLADTSYDDLGYDSLALLEITARIQQTVGRPVPEDLVSKSATPTETVAAVNALLVPVGA